MEDWQYPGTGKEEGCTSEETRWTRTPFHHHTG
jgi:hypothetical protein